MELNYESIRHTVYEYFGYKPEDCIPDFPNTSIHHTVPEYIKKHGDFKIEKLANKKLLFKVNGDEETALHFAAKTGDYLVVSVLLHAARLLDSRSASGSSPQLRSSILDDFVWHPNRDNNTALHLAFNNIKEFTAEALINASRPPHGRDIRNHLGETPVYIAAVKESYISIVRLFQSWEGCLPLDVPHGCPPMLHTLTYAHKGERYGGDIVKFLIRSRKKDMEKSKFGYEAIFDETDKNYDTILSLSVREHLVTVYQTIIKEDPAYDNRRVRKTKDFKSLISVVAKKPEEGYRKMVDLLNKEYEYRKDIGHAGQTLLHKAIMNHDGESVSRLLRDDKDLANKVDSENWTPLHYAAYYEFEEITDIGYKAEASESDNNTAGWIPTPLHVAAKEGHTSTLIKLMDLLPPSLYAAVYSLSGQNILHLAVLSSKKEMILHILNKCPDEHIQEILNQQDMHGDTPLHLLVRDGCFVPELIKHMKVDRKLTNRQRWTSSDMLYFKEQIIGDQVKIKKALDDFQDDQHRKFWQCLMFWRGSIKKKSEKMESIVSPAKRDAKDKEFVKGRVLLRKEMFLQKKDELDRYRQRTNTQIIVTALITTVTFTVGFTMPGGYHQDGELEGMVVLSDKKAFIAFMVTDALALLLSTSSLFLYFIASMYEDPHSVSRLNDASTILNIVSVVAMMFTFIAGTYVVLTHSRALAIIVIVISCFFFLLVVIGLLMKWRYDGKQEKMHEV